MSRTFKFMIMFGILSLFCGSTIIGGIFIFKQSNYGIDSIIYFGITGLLTAICISLTIYCIVRRIKESRQYIPLNNSANSTTDPYNSDYN